MSNNINNSSTRLIDETFKITKTGEKITVSQEAEIGGKRITISLNFNNHVTIENAQNAMRSSLKKVEELAKGFKLGEVHQGKTTGSLSLDREGHVIRAVVSSNQKVRLVKYSKTEVNKKLESQNEKTGSISKNSIRTKIDLDQGSFDKIVIVAHSDSIKDRKILSDSFKIREKKFEEKAERFDTVPTLFEGLKYKIIGLEKKLNGLKLDSEGNKEKIGNVEKEIKKAKKDFVNYRLHLDPEKTTYGSTNMPRFAFKGLGLAKAKECMAPVLFNLRMQTVKTQNSKGVVVSSSVSRSGAISDFTHGEVSLQELKDLNDMLNYDKLTLKRQKELSDLYIRSDSKPDSISSLAVLIKAKALVGYGQEALCSNQDSEVQKILEKLQSSNRLEEAFGKLSDNEISFLEKVEIDQGKMGEVIGQRSNRLKLLVLQDLQMHFENKPVDKDSILYGRTSVLDLQKKANNENGCIIHERTQGLDMKAIFDELDQTTVLFDKDIKAAYVDEEGKIHMPGHCSKEGVESTKLNTVFFNVCVQSGNSAHMYNDGMQKSINDQTLMKLKMRMGKNEQGIKPFEATLNQLSPSEKKDPNHSVMLITEFLQDKGGYSGINCYGGKDRTAYSVALITQRFLQKQAGVEDSDPELIKAGHQLLSSNGIAGQIAKDNADHTTLKLTRLDLKLYNTGSVKGKMLRAAHLINGLCSIIKKKLKGLVNLPKLAVSTVEGQAYKGDYDQKLEEEKIEKINREFHNLGLHSF